MMKKILLLVAAAAAVAGCVPSKKYNSSRAEVMRLESELGSMRLRGDELAARAERLDAEIEQLNGEKAELGRQVAELTERYNRLLSEGSAEAARMLRQLEQSQSQLDERSRRVEELEQLLRAREEAIDEIRRKVAGALLGFEGNGLTITTRNGNVYVSMDDKLLFRSGSFEIESNGAQAVRDLAAVLAQNPDINIMVEGHTDDVPYRGSGNLQDNLDLSAKRATTVTRLLLSGGDIAPERIIAAGRGESFPVAEGTSAEARARNRRTEIILSPKLDELWQIMDR
ncbi:MAG: OmpA family protein [Rikenellaceae bacterium]|nr:OmpA family protein [Rikenellaceae bacterium]